ncbi:MAG: GNAT family N-acetyltransferase [Anaerolineae bacterium]|jgi:GNAT superfamily N-acetyltransferase
MQLTLRAYRDEDDYWRIRAFLRQVMLLNDVREKSWHVARLDYWRWHVAANCQDRDSIDDVVFLWETADGQIAAVLNPEGNGDANLQVHPGWRTPELEDEMLDVAEEHLTAERDGERTLAVWSDPEDALRLAVLERRSYSRGKWAPHEWRRDLYDPIPDVTIPSGYTVRSLGEAHELPARSWASWRGFHPDEPDEDYQGWNWYLNIQRCPLYRRDLDIVAVAPGGEIASFSTFWYDDVTRSAYIEPVATVPEHQRLGLARATITEGLRRVKRLGATRAFVCGYEPAPNALYSSVLSSDHDRSEQWVKRW